MNLRTFVFLSIDNTVGIVLAENRYHAKKLLEKESKHFVFIWELKNKPGVKILGKLR